MEIYHRSILCLKFTPLPLPQIPIRNCLSFVPPLPNGRRSAKLNQEPLDMGAPPPLPPPYRPPKLDVDRAPPPLPPPCRPPLRSLGCAAPAAAAVPASSSLGGSYRCRRLASRRASSPSPLRGPGGFLCTLLIPCERSTSGARSRCLSPPL